MVQMRVCKECGKMFVPKGREQYCSDIHYRPCPVCGELVVAKYLSDPPRKCDKCKGRKMQPATAKPKQLFKIDQPASMLKIPSFDDLAKIASKSEKESKPKSEEVSLTGCSQIDISKLVDPEVFCETYDDKVLRYIGPTIEGLNKFTSNHDYKIALTRKDNAYLITSCHDLTDNKEVNCYYLASSQISVASRFAVVVDVMN